MKTPEELALSLGGTKVEETPAAEKTVETPVVETPAKVEAKVETPAVEAELTTEEKAEMDALLNPPAKAADANAPVKTEPTVTGKFTPEQEKQLSEANELLSNPHIKAMAKYIKDGGKIEDALAKLKPALPDYDKMKAEDIFELELNRLGLDDAAKKNSREDFAKLSDYKKAQELEGIRNRLKSVKQEDSPFETILGTPNAINKPTPEQLHKFKINQANSHDNLVKDVDKLVAEGYMGVPVTQAIRNEILATIEKMPANTKDAEGIPTYDYKDLLDYTLYKKFKNEVVEKAKYEGGVAVYKKLRRPNTEQVGTTATAQNKKTELEQAKAAIDAAFTGK